MKWLLTFTPWKWFCWPLSGRIASYCTHSVQWESFLAAVMTNWICFVPWWTFYCSVIWSNGAGPGAVLLFGVGYKQHFRSCYSNLIILRHGSSPSLQRSPSQQQRQCELIQKSGIHCCPNQAGLSFCFSWILQLYVSLHFFVMSFSPFACFTPWKSFYRLETSLLESDL